MRVDETEHWLDENFHLVSNQAEGWLCVVTNLFRSISYSRGVKWTDD